MLIVSKQTNKQNHKHTFIKFKLLMQQRDFQYNSFFSVVDKDWSGKISSATRVDLV